MSHIIKTLGYQPRINKVRETLISYGVIALRSAVIG